MYRQSGWLVANEVAAGGGTGVAWIDRGVDVSCIEGNVAVLRAFGLVLLDRGDVEGGQGRGIWCLSRCGEGERRDGGEEQLADDGHRSRLLAECTSETGQAGFRRQRRTEGLQSLVIGSGW
jgi:hypothetical protein